MTETKENERPGGLPFRYKAVRPRRRPSAARRYVLLCAVPATGQRINGFVQARFGDSLTISLRSNKTNGCLLPFAGLPTVDNTPGITGISMERKTHGPWVKIDGMGGNERY